MVRGLCLLAGVTAASEGIFGGGAFETRVWRPSEKGFPEMNDFKDVLPHLEGRENLGIALAGGGGRGMALAQGYVRALHEQGILDKAKYLTVSSGSVWLALPLYFQETDTVEAFLGKSMPLGELSPYKLVDEEVAGTALHRLHWPVKDFAGWKPTGEFGSEGNSTGRKLRGLHPEEMLEKALDCLRHPCSCAVKEVFPEFSSTHELWQWVSGLMLMEPFHLARPDSVYCHSSQADSVRKRVGPFTHVYESKDVERNLPFLISQSAVYALHSGSDRAANPMTAFPHENTLLYSGVPVAFTGEDVRTEEYAGLGDLYVEPFASSSEALGPIKDGKVKVKRHTNRKNLGSIVEWEAQTTNLFSMYQTRSWYYKHAKNSCYDQLFNSVLPQQWMFSHLDENRQGVPKSRPLPVGDAGVYDDNGHLPLLRRKVKNIIIFDSWVHHDDPDGDMLYTKTAFGYPTSFMNISNAHGAPNPMEKEGFLTVFEPTEFPPLLAEVQRLRDARKPAVVRGNFTVLENKHWGIEGGWKAEVIFVFALPVDQFFDELQVESRSKMKTYFPNYDSTEPRNRFDLSLISQYASWMVNSAVMKEVDAMLGANAEEVVV